MNIIVTGGYGFIGSHLCNYLSDKGCNVYNIDCQTYACDYVNIKDIKVYKHLKFSINDTKKLHDFISSTPFQFDAIIHLAAESHVDNSISHPSHFTTTNVLGTANMLEIAKRGWVNKFLYVSTDEVYGSLGENEPSWDELQPLQPRSPYSATKASGDLLTLSYFHTYNMNVNITRCCNNFGIGQHAEKLIPKSILNANKHGFIELYGDGKNIREWIHAEDHARAIYKVLQFGQPGDIFNVGTNIELTNNQIAELVIKATGKNVDINYINDRKGHDKKYSVNFDKIKKLGFNPRRKITDDKEWDEMVQYYKKYQKA